MPKSKDEKIKEELEDLTERSLLVLREALESSDEKIRVQTAKEIAKWKVGNDENAGTNFILKFDVEKFTKGLSALKGIKRRKQIDE